MEFLKIFLKDLKNSIKDLIPIVAVVLFFQLIIIQKMPENSVSIIIGLVIVAIGLALFIRGLELGIFPVGEKLAFEFSKKGSIFWLLIFSFLIGFSTTIAEPALIAIADKAQVISSGKIDAYLLRLTVAISVGFAISLGVFRIIIGHPLHYYIIIGYIIAVIITFFTPKDIVGLAYDSGGITTSTVTVPLVAALGIGLASSIKGRNPVIDGFGLIAFASLTPIIFVQIYGIISNYFFHDQNTMISLAKASATKIDEIVNYKLEKIFLDLISVIKDILPILFVIFLFQYFIIKKRLPHLKKIAFGIILVILGLYAFIQGLEIGLFPIGETLAFQLTSMNQIYLVYIFSFLIGFSTTMAEPALLAIALKAQEVSNDKIKSTLLRVFVALGVAIGISLGAYRIVTGDKLHYYLIAGYIVVIIVTYFAPKYIIPIAYDSGGVTTSTVTVPLVAALGLGLAKNLPNRDPLIDGFGIIAFASLFPMITVMSYGIYANFKSKDKK